MKKAIIDDQKIVRNIIEYSSDEAIAGLVWPTGWMSWDVTNIPAGIGDTFEDGVFYREGEPIQPQPSIDTRVAIVEEESEHLAATLDYVAMMVDVDIPEVI